jgi:hypothetical protein
VTLQQARAQDGHRGEGKDYELAGFPGSSNPLMLLKVKIGFSQVIQHGLII